MKRLIIAICLTFGFASMASADVLVLNSPQTEVSPIVISLDWRRITLDLGNQDNVLTVQYFKLNAAGQRIPMSNGAVRRTWICRDMVDNPETTEDETSTCWSDVFMFNIRTQDVGSPIGRGLRQLIFNQMKNDPDVINPGNDGSFDD